MEPAAEPHSRTAGGTRAAVLQPDAPGLPCPDLHHGNRGSLPGPALAGGTRGAHTEQQEPHLGQDCRVYPLCARDHCSLVGPLQGEDSGNYLAGVCVFI